MASLIKNEQLPGTSPPPTSSFVTVAAPPPYPPPYASIPQTSVIVVRNQQFYEPDPPGLTAKATISLVLSIIALFLAVPFLCALPSLILAILALSRSYDTTQRKQYANIALGLMVASYVTIAVFFILYVAVLIPFY